MVTTSLTAPAVDGRLRADPAAAAPEKATFESVPSRTIGAEGAFGIEERGILLTMDTQLPLWAPDDAKTRDSIAAALHDVTTGLASYPAFRGWSWAANWWIRKTGADAASSPDEKAAYVAALKQADATGAWSPVLDAVSDRIQAQPGAAERDLRALLRKDAPDELSVMTGPYRALGVYPPVAFRGADEVELHFQAEQIQPPLASANDADFYARPGKRAWGHPEAWNDDGTGATVLSTLFAMAMRGADGVGWSGEPHFWSYRAPSDPRSAAPGTLSVLRAADHLLLDYGPWLTSLRPSDPVAIVVSSRMFRIDRFVGMEGSYFGRLYEAYGACMAAHTPAHYVFSDDLGPDTLAAYPTVLVVDQRVEMEPKLAQALAAARAAGGAVFYDGTSRPELVPGLAPLGVSFDAVERGPVWQSDAEYARIPAIFAKDAAAMTKTLGARAHPVAGVEATASHEAGDPAILLTRRTSGRARFVWALNEVEPDPDPGLAWRTGLLVASRMPLVVPLKLDAAPAEAVYDVFAERRVQPAGGVVDADLRDTAARLFAILPRPVDAVELALPRGATAGGDLAWSVTVLDDKGQPVETTVPLRVELVAPDGVVLDSARVLDRREGSRVGRVAGAARPAAGRGLGARDGEIQRKAGHGRRAGRGGRSRRRPPRRAAGRGEQSAAHDDDRPRRGPGAARRPGLRAAREGPHDLAGRGRRGARRDGPRRESVRGRPRDGAGALAAPRGQPLRVRAAGRGRRHRRRGVRIG